MVPAILDFEASGLGSGSYPIEVGYVLADGRSACYLISPEPDWLHWNDAAERLHGIPRELLLRNGRTVKDVARLLNEQLAGITIYSDAWGHDFTWLSLLFDRAELVPSFRLQPLSLLLSELEQEVWDDMRDVIAAELALVRHRASTDARILQATYVRTLSLRDPALPLPGSSARLRA